MANEPEPRYVVVEMITEDWGAVDPAAYMALASPGFMGTIRTSEVRGDVPLPPLETTEWQCEWSWHRST
jgi:hypothetical protein